MSDIILRSDLKVEYINHMGNDLSIAKAAWVSTGKDDRGDDPGKTAGVIEFLMKNRHGTPFEHGSLTVRVEAPIFIWREWHRHRIGFSYNEESGRYKKLDPVFYVPGPERAEHCMKPEGFKPSKPGFRGMLPVESAQHIARDNRDLEKVYRESYDAYETRLQVGYDNGLARICLPVSIYSACYVTCNPRSLMSFLELRTDIERATRRSHPLWEMHNVAAQLESVFMQLWPMTYTAWSANGRMAP